jgi:hypothetical protein
MEQLSIHGVPCKIVTIHGVEYRLGPIAGEAWRALPKDATPDETETAWVAASLEAGRNPDGADKAFVDSLPVVAVRRKLWGAVLEVNEIKVGEPEAAPVAAKNDLNPDTSTAR